jgi:HEAT repeat protein
MGKRGKRLSGIVVFDWGIGLTRSRTTMLPIRCASSTFAGFLGGSALLLVLGVLVGGRGEASPLPTLGVEEFRTLLDSKRNSGIGDKSSPALLAERRRKLNEAAAGLLSLGEVSRALLLTEWGAAELVSDTTVSLKEIEEAVRQPDEEAFKSKVEELMRKTPDDSGVGRAIVAEIKRDVRLRLLDRLEERTRFYLHGKREEDRIAAANLLSETLTKSRRQYVGIMVDKTRDAAPTARYLRRRLRNLTPDVQQLLRDANLQVQVAGIRALSNLEIDSAVLVNDVKPLLTSARSNVVLRRASAEGLANALDVMYTQWEKEKSRPQPLVKSVEHILPLAVRGLSDEDVGVRRGCLIACYQAARLLDDLARDPLAAQERRELFRPVLAVVEANLPAINARAGDAEPALRIAACRVLEMLALASQRLRYLRDRPTPSSIPDPTVPKLPCDNREGVSLPAKHGGRRTSIVRSNSWASDRSPSSAKMPTVQRGEATPAVTLAPPVVRADERTAVRTASFLAPPGELPTPRADNPFRGSVDAMIKDLSDKDYRVRLAAVDMLETLGDRSESAIPALVKALGDSDKFVRWASARTLGRLNPRRADEVVRGLQGLLNDREDPSVRIAAAEALRQYGGAAKDAVPHLARVINRGDKDYILVILQTLQGIGTEAAPALPNVAWILRDRSQPSVVRIEAAQTLGRFGALAKEQLKVLRDIMANDPDEEVRDAASTAVLSIDRPRK